MLQYTTFLVSIITQMLLQSLVSYAFVVYNTITVMVINSIIVVITVIPYLHAHTKQVKIAITDKTNRISMLPHGLRLSDLHGLRLTDLQVSMD